jgi:hypothetical protein
MRSTATAEPTKKAISKQIQQMENKLAWNCKDVTG